MSDSPPESSTDDTTPVSPRLPSEPPNLADYEITRRLGEGGMGVVWLAEHRKLRRPVALKVIRPDWLPHPGALRRFGHEIRAVLRLNHPNIVTVYDADDQGGVYFLAMEYLQGATLGQMVRQTGQLGVREACELVGQAAEGLQHAFEAGIVHRDIKPQNLMVTRPSQSGRPLLKILDFGLARASEAADGSWTPITRAGAVYGTVDFVAPEQIQDASTVTTAADLYSLGATFFFLLTGRLLFPVDSVKEKLAAHRFSEPPDLGRFRPNLPAGLEQVVGTLLMKHPRDRYGSPAELVEALEPFRRGEIRGAVRVAATDTVAYTGPPRPSTLSRPMPLPTRPATPPPDSLPPLKLSSSTPTPVGVRLRRPLPSGLPLAERRHWRLSADSVRAAVLGSHGCSFVSGGSSRLGRFWLAGGGLTPLDGRLPALKVLAATPDGRRLLAVSGDDPAPVCYDGETGEALMRLDVPGGPTDGLALCPNGRIAVTGTADGWLRVWDVEDGRELASQRVGGPVRHALIDADGRALLALSSEPALYRWDLQGGVPRAVSVAPQFQRWVLAPPVYSLSATAVACGHHDGAVEIWPVSGSRSCRRWLPFDNPVTALAVSHAGDRILVGQEDGRLTLLGLGEDDGDLGATPAHSCPVTAVAFGPDDRRALSGGTDGVVRLWQLPPPE